MIRNKIADKVTLLGQTKNKEKEERQEIYISLEKRQEIIDDLIFFLTSYKMEYQKIANVLGTAPNEMPRFVTKKWLEVHDQSGDANDRYKPNKSIRFKTSMLRSDLCDFSDASIVVKGDITLKKVANRDFTDVRNRFLAFKNKAPFTNCISKINNVSIDNAKDLHIVIPMYNLLEYSKNY